MTTDAEYFQGARKAAYEESLKAPIPLISEDDLVSSGAAQPQDLEAVNYTQSVSPTITTQRTALPSELDAIHEVVKSNDAELINKVRKARPDVFATYIDKNIGDFNNKWGAQILNSSIKNRKTLSALSDLDSKGALDIVKEQRPILYQDYQTLKNMGWSSDRQVVLDDIQTASNPVSNSFKKAVSSAATKSAGKLGYGPDNKPGIFGASKILADMAQQKVKEATGFAVDLAFPEKESLEREAGLLGGVTEEVPRGVYGAVDVAYIVDKDPEAAAEIVRGSANSLLGQLNPSMDAGYKTMKFSGRTKFGHPTFTVDEDVPGGPKAGERFYWNTPGLSLNDVEEMKYQAGEALIATGTRGMKFASSIARVAMGAFFTSTVRQYRQEVQRGAPLDLREPAGQGTHIGIGKTAGVEAAFSVTADAAMVPIQAFAVGLKNVTTRMVSSITGDTSLVSKLVTPDGVVTPEGVAFFKENGIDANQLTGEVILHMVEGVKNPKSPFADEQVMLALASAFDQTPILNEILRNVDNTALTIIDSVERLSRTGGTYGQQIRALYNLDDERLARVLYQAADNVSGESPLRMQEKLRELNPIFKNAHDTHFKEGSNLYDQAFEVAQQAGKGDVPLSPTQVVDAYNDIYTRYGIDNANYKAALTAVENELVRFGALSDPQWYKEAVAAKKDALAASKIKSLNAIKSAADRAEFVRDSKEFMEGVEAAVQESEALIREVASEAADLRREAFKARQQITRAERAGASEQSLEELTQELSVRLSEFRDFRAAEGRYTKEQIEALRGRKLSNAQYKTELKRQQIEDTKALKIEQLDNLIALREQVEIETLNRKLASKVEFPEFNIEAATKLDRALGGLVKKTPNFKSALYSVRNATRSTFSAIPDNEVTEMYTKALNHWRTGKAMYEADSIALGLASRALNGTGTQPEIAASELLKTLKSKDIKFVESLLDTIKSSKQIPGVVGESMVAADNLLKSAVYLDVVEDLLKITSDYRGTPSAAVTAYPKSSLRVSEKARSIDLEAFEAVVNKWGSDKLDILLKPNDRKILYSLNKLLESRRRHPVNSLSAETAEVGILRELADSITSTAWLAANNPSVAVPVGMYKFGKLRTAKTAGRKFADNILAPVDTMQARWDAYMKDPVKFNALTTMPLDRDINKLFKSELSKTTLKDLRKVEFDPTDRIGLRDRQPFSDSKKVEWTALDTIKSSHPYLHEWLSREHQRSLKRRAISLPAAEIGRSKYEENSNASQ